MRRGPFSALASANSAMKELPIATGKTYSHCGSPIGVVTAFLEKTEDPPTDQINAGCYVFSRETIDRIPRGREVSVEREVFPAMVAGPVFWRNISHDDPYKAVIRAYNDWLAEEYCAVAPDRLFGMGVMPNIW